MQTCDQSGMSRNGQWGGSSTSTLLLLLLLVVAAGGYVYYFTDLLRPNGGEPVQVVTAPQVMPMPARQTQISSAQTTIKAPAAKPQPPAPLVKTPPAKGTEKPVAVKSVQPQQPKGMQSPAPLPVKPLPPKVVKAPASPPSTPQQVAPQEEKPVVEGVKYQLHVGDYTSEESLADAKAKVRKAGFSAVVKRQGEKRMTMNRLYHSSHGDKNSAEQALAMLKKEIDGPFILRENGKYVVYAGSYQNEQTALGEQERLSLLGTTLVLRKADVKLPVSRLTTGSFPSKEAAQKGGARLKKMGLHPSVQRAR